jgi:predicted nucleic acid-binding Zn ribbon protein
MIDGTEQLRRAARRPAAHRANNTVSLGDLLNELIEKQVSPRQTRFGLIAEAWDQLLPTELCQHCRIVDISGGRLKVLADSPSYMYQLQLCSSELLKELARCCPRARIKEIRFAIG